MKWTKHRVPDKRGKPIDLYVSGDYKICQDIRAPCEKGRFSAEWHFGVYYRDKYVSEAPTLGRAKELATIHEDLGDDF